MNQAASMTSTAPTETALSLSISGSGTATALFLKFQNQVWHTLGQWPSLARQSRGPIPDTGPINPWPIVSPDSPYHLASWPPWSILVFMTGSEFVTILNTPDRTLDLTDWKILDKHDKADRISGTIEPGHDYLTHWRRAQLSNEGAP
jgi:hypothetical protein